MRIFDKFLNLIKFGLQSELLSGSFIIFIGGTFSSFLAFILNIYLARNLSYSDYGIYIVLLSIFTLAIIPGQSLGTVIVRFATQFYSSGELNSFSAFYKKTIKALMVVGSIFLFITIFLSQYVSSFLQIDENTLVIFVAFLVAINYILILNISYVNSILKFKELSISFAISGIVKLIAGVSFVYLGFEVYGALGAILVLILIQLFYLFRVLRNKIDFSVKDINLPLFDMFKYALPATLAILSLYSFVSIDVILIKHFFNSYQAGLYGGLSLVGKVIFYFTLPIPAVLFPLVVTRQSRKQGHSSLLFLALGVVFIASSLITVFYYFLPELTINIFLGGKDYLLIAPYLGLFGVFLTIYSLNNVFMMYFLSIKRTLMSIFVFIFALFQFILIANFHNDFRQVILISIGTSLLLLVSFILYYFKDNFLARS